MEREKEGKPAALCHNSCLVKEAAGDLILQGNNIQHHKIKWNSVNGYQMNLVVDINLALQLYSQTGLFYMLWRNLSTPNDKYTLYLKNVEAEREAEELWSVSETVSVKQYQYMLCQDVYICELF